MREKYYMYDTEVLDYHKYSYYVNRYEKMNYQEFIGQSQSDLQELKMEAGYYEYKSPCHNEICRTMGRLKNFIFFMGQNFHPDEWDTVAFCWDEVLRRQIYDNSDLIAPPISNDISEEEKFYVFNRGAGNYKRSKLRDEKIEAANFTEDEKSRYTAELLNSPFTDPEDVADSAFNTIMSEREQYTSK